MPALTNRCVVFISPPHHEFFLSRYESKQITKRSKLYRPQWRDRIQFEKQFANFDRWNFLLVQSVQKMEKKIFCKDFINIKL